MTKVSTVSIKKEGKVLKIELPSRLDEKNSPEVSSEIAENLDPDIERIRFDAKNLRYISPDGLDIILDLKKKYSDVTVENAGMGICDTLEAFGFNNFVEIGKQYRFVSVKDNEVIGHGGHGTIYRIDKDMIIKVYRDNSPLETIENERRFARNAFINGIPTAIAFDVVETEYGYGVVFEMLNGTTLGKYLAKHPEKLEEYGVKFADLLYKLNTTDADKDLYGDFHNVYLERAENTKKYIPEKDAETLKRVILSIPRGSGMIHGDYHPNNVMIDDSGELMLIDMADISRGNGFFDVGGAFLVMNFMEKIPILRRFVKYITSMDYKSNLKMWDVFIRRYYHTDDAAVLNRYEEQFRAFANLRISASSLGMKTSRPKIVTRIIALYAKLFVVPKADKYIKLFSTLQ